MRQHQGLDAVPSGLEVGEVGDDEIHPELVGVGKHHTGINQDGRVLPGHGHHVHAEFPEATKRYDLERGRNNLRQDRLVHQEPVWAASLHSASDPHPGRCSDRGGSGRWDRLKLWLEQRLAGKTIAQLWRSGRNPRSRAPPGVPFHQLQLCQSVRRHSSRRWRRPAGGRCSAACGAAERPPGRYG